MHKKLTKDFIFPFYSFWQSGIIITVLAMIVTDILVRHNHVITLINGTLGFYPLFSMFVYNSPPWFSNSTGMPLPEYYCTVCL